MRIRKKSLGRPAEGSWLDWPVQERKEDNADKARGIFTGR